MPATNIVIIGVGSASFGPATLATILRSSVLKGSHLGLVDLNEESLDKVTRVAHRMNEEWGADMTIQASADRRDLLAGVKFVIVSIEVPPREVLWRMDWEIPTKHGLRTPYGENGGPGGLMHTCRQVPPLIEIARDMEKLCPDAYLINFSNPLPRLTRAITKYTNIQTVGKCHQIEVGYGMTATLLADQYGIDVPENMHFRSDPDNLARHHQMTRAGRKYFDIKAAGLNHFTWILDVRDKETGEDLYPTLRQAAQNPPASLDPLSMEVFRLLDYCPVPGDTHLCEYLPWLHDPVTKPWEHYRIPLYDWGGNEASRDFQWHQLTRMADGKMSIAGMKDVPSEGAVEIMEGIVGSMNTYDDAVDIPNQGLIGNLPAETVVEVPAVMSGMGVQGLYMGDLPSPIDELCRREAALVEAVVDAAVTGDKRLAMHALLLDPTINDISRAQALLDDYLTQFADYLPQF